jgi:methylenetetrahydrofolate dehydrogenase (NADP+)/methenyltetrahydrofolate cyclohydrolase
MQSRVIDGKAVAADVRAGVAKDVAALKAAHGLTPGLAVVLVGEDPASKVYVKNKGEQTKEAGMNSWEYKLPAETSEAEILAVVEKLNNDPAVNGILVQLPLPKHVNAERVLNTIDPNKDVDGFHPVNVGRLWIGERTLVPCTPTGSVILAKTVQPNLSGLNAVVIGRSNIVGKPVAALLLRENCTVTVAHSRTRNIESVVKGADLLIAAVGIPEMVKGDWVKPGAIVIDVGINRVPSANGKTKLVGDCDYEDCARVAGAITPVPGGVGPMTIACLLKNTLEAAQMQHGLPVQSTGA